MTERQPSQVLDDSASPTTYRRRAPGPLFAFLAATVLVLIAIYLIIYKGFGRQLLPSVCEAAALAVAIILYGYGIEAIMSAPRSAIGLSPAVGPIMTMGIDEQLEASHGPEDSTPSEWAYRLVAAIVSKLAAAYGESRSLPEGFQLHSIRALSSEEVELIFSIAYDGALRGMRIDLDSVKAARWRISESSIDGLAWDLVNIWFDEPRVMDEFSPPDEDGVRWFAVAKWFDEVS